MTVKLSRHKISRILKYYFTGVPQPAIARRVGVNQSTVSLYASRFKGITAEVGLLAAGKEFNVFKEIDELRSLSVELLKVNLTAEDAREGVKIIRAFNKLGIDPDQHIGLIEVCKKVDDPGFINAALKLTKIETEVGMSYEEITSRCESVASELPSTEERLKDKQATLKSLDEALDQKRRELSNLEGQMVQLERENRNVKAKMDQELETKKKQLNIRSEEIEEIAKLKEDLVKRDLDIPTLVSLAKEYIYGSI